MRKILLYAMATAVLVVLFASTQGTAALWRAEETLKPGTITTGIPSLAEGDGSSMSQDFAFKDLNTSTLTPGRIVQAPLTVSKTGTTGLSYTLAGAAAATTPQGAVLAASETDCVQVVLPADALQAAAGEAFELVLRWRGDQL